MSGTGSSMGNLNHHLLNHWDKIDKQVKKQSGILDKFLSGNKQIVCI